MKIIIILMWYIFLCIKFLKKIFIFHRIIYHTKIIKEILLAPLSLNIKYYFVYKVDGCLLTVFVGFYNFK